MTSEVRNKRAKKDAPKSGFKPAEFLNHNFTDADKAGFRKWAMEYGPRLAELVDRTLENGYSISIKHDNYNDCESAFLQTRDADDQNEGFILTGRSRSGSMALLAALYRHYVLFEQQWPIEGVAHSRVDDE